MKIFTAIALAATILSLASQAQAQARTIKSFDIPFKVNSLSSLVDSEDAASALQARTILLNAPKTVKLVDDLTNLFEKNNCQLDPGMLQKLKKAQAKILNVETAIPAEIYRAFGEEVLNSNVVKISDTDANASLHVVFIPIAGTDDKQPLFLTGAGTYRTRSALEFADTVMTDFAYATDCSAFLNFAVDAGASFPLGKTDAQIKQAVKNKYSTILMRAHVYSPAAAAMNPSVGGGELSKADRLDILFAIIAELDEYAQSNGITLADNLRISTWRKVDLVWASNSGQSTYTGKVDVAANVSGGFGIATMKADTSGGAGISKNVSYKQLDTYVLRNDAVETTRDYSVLKSALVDDFSAIKPSSIKRIEGTHIEILVPDILKKACDKSWKIASSATSPAGDVSTELKKEGCLFTFKPNTSIVADTKLTLTAEMIKTPKLEISWNFISPHFNKQ